MIDWRDWKHCVVVVNKHPYLFVDLRISRDSVPDGLYVYDVADGGGDGRFTRIQPFIMVNYWGTIIGKHELPLENGRYYPEYGTAEYDGTYIDYMTLGEFIKANESEFDLEIEDVPDGFVPVNWHYLNYPELSHYQSDEGDIYG